MKRAVLLIVALVMLLAVFLVLPASATQYSGTCGEGVTWNYDATTKTLTISGQGRMDDYPATADDSHMAPWYVYRDEITTVIIDSGVTYIGDYAFTRCSALTDVTIADTVTELGGGVFFSAKGLRQIVIPESVTKMGKWTFSSCSSLENVVLPRYIDEIPECTFDSCSNLQDVVMPDNLKTIGEKAFTACTSLENMRIPDGVETIETHAFSDCTNLIGVAIPASVQLLEGLVFNGCYRLLEVVFLGSVPNRGLDTLDKTYLMIYYPADDSSWSQLRGSYWDRSHFWIPVEDPAQVQLQEYGGPIGGRCGENTVWRLDDGVLTVSGTGTVDGASWDGYQAEVRSAFFEEGITNVPDGALMGGKQLTSVSMADSVTRIGSGAFNHCPALCDIRMPKKLVQIGDYAFSYSHLVTSISLYDGLESIGANAFEDCEGLTQITFPKTLKEIGDNAFRFCEALKEIVFLGDAPQIAENAFAQVRGFAYYPRGNSTWTRDARASYGAYSLQWSAGNGNGTSCGDNLSWKYQDGTLIFTGTGRMEDYSASRVAPWRSKADKVTKVIIPEGVTYIGRQAFREMNNLEEVILPDSVSRMGQEAFAFCTALAEIDLPKNLTQIDAWCFSGCSNLRSIVIPDKVRQIGEGAFWGCTQLEKVTLGASVEKLDKDTFSCCFELKEVTFLGDAPVIQSCIFDECEATVYYPAGNTTWDGVANKNYSGEMTWVPKCLVVHVFGEWEQIQAPTQESVGKEQRVCPYCGLDEVRDIPKSPATPSAPPDDKIPEETVPTTKPNPQPTVPQPTLPQGTENTELDSTKPGNTEPKSTTDDEPSGSKNVWWIVVIAVSVLAGGGVTVAVYWSKRRSKTE